MARAFLFSNMLLPQPLGLMLSGWDSPVFTGMVCGQCSSGFIGQLECYIDPLSAVAFHWAARVVH